MEVSREELQRRVAECTVFSHSIFGHEVVHITSTALSVYSNCVAVFLIKLQR